MIDWGDMHLGDPALDLSLAFTFLPPSARARFFDAYQDAGGRLDPHARDRARFRGLYYGPILLEYGQRTGDPAMAAIGRWALEHTPAHA